MRPTMFILACVVMLFGTANLGLAQFSSNIQGVVQDPSEAVIPDADVRLRNLDTQVERRTSTGPAGVYRFASLAPGNYEVLAEASGFQPRSVELSLLTAQTADLNLVLEVRGTAERVVVSGEAPLLATADSRVSTTINERELHDLPLQGRNFLGLMAITPGVTGTGLLGGNSIQTVADNFEIEKFIDANSNGRNGSGNFFMMDGLSVTSNIWPGGINISPNPESIEEVAIQTSSFSVEQGRSSSIAVAITTKSGTNEYHGSGTYYFTNQDFLARTVFTGGDPLPSKRNDFTGAVGGPIVKNHTFFFVNANALRANTSSGDAVQTFETSEFLGFAQQTFPSSIGTQLLSDHVPERIVRTGVVTRAQDVFADCGTPTTFNIPCDLPLVAEGTFTPSPFRNALQWSARADQYFNDARDRIYFNYLRNDLDKESTTVRRGFESVSDSDSWMTQGNWTHTFSPTVLNQFNFGYFSIKGNGVQDTGVPFRIPSVGIDGQGLGINPGWGPSNFIQNHTTFRNVVNVLKGSHSLKIGGQYYYGESDLLGFAAVQARPSYGFNNLLDLIQDKPFTQNGPAYNVVTGQETASGWLYVMSTFGLFVQDEWKVAPNLTLTLGLRWDDHGNAYNGNDDPNKGVVGLTNIVLGSGSDLASQIAGARLQPVDNVLNSPIRSISPRIGFAWDPSRKGDWVVRGGFGVFHDWVTLTQQAEHVLTFNPDPEGGTIFPTFFATSDPKPVFSLGRSDSFPFGFPAPPIPGDASIPIFGASGTDRDLDPQRTYKWSLGVERALPNSFVAGIMYNGSISRDYVIATNYNRFPGDLLDGSLDRLNPLYTNLRWDNNGGESDYNAMTVMLRHSRGRSTFQTSYTLSHVTDIGWGGDEWEAYGTRGREVSLPDWRLLSSGRYEADSLYDHRHRFALSGVYDIPSFKGSSGAAKGILGGWELTTLWVFQTGAPFAVRNQAGFQPLLDDTGNVIGFQPGSGDYNADGHNWDLPNTPSGDFSGSHSRQQYINGLFTAADFPAPAPGSEGNLPRNPYRNPGLINIDLGLIKNNPLPFFGETGNLQLRFDFFNILNRVNLRGVNGDMSSGVFGRATSTFNPRFIQFGARIIF